MLRLLVTMEILFIGLMLGSDLRKRYLVTEVPNMWEVSMGGSHTTIWPVTRDDNFKILGNKYYIV
jgi:hypothetical protein